jgi:hypothetical protein
MPTATESPSPHPAGLAIPYSRTDGYGSLNRWLHGYDGLRIGLVVNRLEGQGLPPPRHSYCRTRETPDFISWRHKSQRRIGVLPVGDCDLAGLV